MAFFAQRSVDGVPCGRVAGGLEVAFDRAGVVQEPKYVGAAGGKFQSGVPEETSGGER